MQLHHSLLEAVELTRPGAELDLAGASELDLCWALPERLGLEVAGTEQNEVLVVAAEGCMQLFHELLVAEEAARPDVGLGAVVLGPAV